MKHIFSFLVLASAAMTAAAQTMPRDLSAQPPRVESAAAHVLTQPTAAGNTRLEVRMANDEALPSLIRVDLEFGKATLRDDGKAGDAYAGDRVYSAIVPLDLAALKRNQTRLAKLQNTLGKPLVMPVYAGRERVAKLKLPSDFFRPISPGSRIPLDRWGFPEAVDSEKSVLIRDTGVVEDPGRTYDPCNDTGTPMGKWTFGFLMSQIANPDYTGFDPADFVQAWVELSRNLQSVNGWSNAPFPINWDEVVEEWPTVDGKLDLAKAPFKLLAIVNRVDLRHNVVYGGSNAGEARFVFGFRRCSLIGAPAEISPKLTVILEYGIQKSGCMSLKSWAKQWQALGDLALGSVAYNTALETITDQFSLAGAMPAKANQSALNQLRVNGGATEGIWEMREFRLPTKGPAARLFMLTTVKQTPDTRLLGAAYPFPNDLTDYVNGDTPAILADEHRVPNLYNGRPFVSGVADGKPFPSGWNLPGVVNREARHKFALQSCNGCHMRETGTSDFYHVGPTVYGSPAPLSGFMTGIDVADPFDGMPVRHFDELERRAIDLDSVANSICIAFIDPNERFGTLRRRGPIPLNMEH